MNNATITIHANELIAILEDYYKKLDATIEIKTERIYTGLYETEECKTTIELTKNLKIGNSIGTITEILTEEDILEILKPMLNDLGYDPQFLVLLSQFECQGYGCAESFEPVFKGAQFQVTKLQHKTLSKNK